MSDGLQLAIEAGGVGTWDLDVATGEVVWSDLARDQLGLADTPGADMETLMRRIHPDDRDAVRHATMRAIFERGLLRSRFRIVRADGDVRHVHLQARTFADASGKPHRLVGVALDVT